MSDAISKAIEAMEWMMVDYEHLNVIGDSLSANWVLRVQAVKDAIASLQAMQGEPVYAFRRKGLIDFCTCDKRRYLELKEKPTIFEVAIFYTHPQPAVPEEWVEAVSRAAEYIKHLQESPNTRSLQGAVLLAGFDDLLSAAKGRQNE
jgi:hypothetical protein